MNELLVYPNLDLYPSNFPSLGRTAVESLSFLSGMSTLGHILFSVLPPPPVACHLHCTSPTSDIITPTSDHDMPFQWLSIV